MVITLRPYQDQAVEALLTHDRFILADEPGMGKTYPAIHAAAVVKGEKPVLVVVPGYLMYQWRDAIHAYCGPDELVYPMERKNPIIDAAFTGWVVISYHTLQNGGINAHPELCRIKFSAVIFDEAHRLRGRKSQWTRNAKRLRTDRIWMLTGTPLVNNPGDVWTLANLMFPRDYTSYWRFVETWCRLEYTAFTTIVHGIQPGKEDAFNDLLAPYFMRRKLVDHVHELPDRPIAQHIAVTLNSKALKAHRRALQDWYIENPDTHIVTVASSGGALVIKLRHLTAGTLVDGPEAEEKTDTVVSLIDDHADQSHVVFTWFKSTAQKIVDKLTQGGYQVFLITGDIPPTQRELLIANWKQSERGIIVATMASMQEGVNLQKSNSVIFAEHHYLPGTIEQAVARCHRYGQTRQVRVYHLIARGTVDESVWRVMTERHNNVTKALLEDMIMQQLTN